MQSIKRFSLRGYSFSCAVAVGLSIAPTQSQISNKQLVSTSPTTPSASQPLVQPSPPEAILRFAAQGREVSAGELLAEQKSPWVDRDRAMHRRLLANARTELFVAPVQISGYGFDRSTRARMTSDLYVFLRGDPTRSSVDTGTIDRALGEGRRNMEMTELRALGSQLGARRFLSVSIGHNDKNEFRVNARWAIRDGVSDAWGTESNRDFVLPMPKGWAFVESFRQLAIPQIAQATGWKFTELKQQKTVVVGDAWPKDFEQLLALPTSGTYGEALSYQMLATVAPPRPERVRERLYERSLQALESLPKDSWRVRWLEANAEFNLNSRPTALKKLGAADSSASAALKELMNGNLPQLEKAVGEIKQESFRLMLEVALQDLRSRYNVPIRNKVPQQGPGLARSDRIWQALFERRFQDLDSWYVQSNLAVKRVLDDVAPVPDLSLETMMRGKRVTSSDFDPVALGLTSFDHINRLRETDDRVQSCANRRSACLYVAMLDLFEGIAVFNETKNLVLVGINQALYENVDALERRLSRKLEGQPEYALAMASIAVGRARRVPVQSPLLAEIMNASERHAKVAAYWEMGQSATSLDALSLAEIGTHRGLAPFFRGYSRDRPMHRDARSFGAPGSPTSEDEGWAVSVEWINQSAFDLRPFDGPIDLFESHTRGYSPEDVRRIDLHYADRRAHLLRELEARFDGHPERARYIARASVSQPKQLTMFDHFEIAKRERPNDWEPYYFVGNRLIEENGDFKRAADVFGQFPGFHNASGHNRVALSNQAWDAGAQLFWRGELDTAKRFFKISADLDTGSEASIRSKTRVNFLEGRFSDALQGSREAATRYDSAYAYRDYLAWLFVLGFPEDAWAGFDQLYAKLPNPQVWYAAHVGLLKAGTTWQDTKKWLLKEPYRTSTVGQERSALATAVLLNTVDRKPAQDLVDVLRLIEGEPRAQVSTAGVHVPDVGGGVTKKLPISILVAGRKLPEKSTPLESHLTLFADAYLSLRQGDYAQARTRFERMANFYPIEQVIYHGHKTVYSYTLSYFAMAAAKSGDPNAIEKSLRNRNPIFKNDEASNNNMRFDHYLALGIFSALRAEHEKAIAELKEAFNTRPHTERRPIYTEYQWAEVCEWLFLETKDQRYRELVLPWLKAHQKMQPMHAWAYAMEAKLTTSEKDRQRALGLALYLDPLSERANEFSAAVRAKAIESVKSTNPFTQKSSKGTRIKSAA